MNRLRHVRAFASLHAWGQRGVIIWALHGCALLLEWVIKGSAKHGSNIRKGVARKSGRIRFHRDRTVTLLVAARLRSDLVQILVTESTLFELISAELGRA